MDLFAHKCCLFLFYFLTLFLYLIDKKKILKLDYLEGDLKQKNINFQQKNYRSICFLIELSRCTNARFLKFGGF